MMRIDDDIELLKSSDLLDDRWYLSRFEDVRLLKMSAAEHYLRLGYRLGRPPSPNFCGETYIKQYPDVKASRGNPLVHYLRSGQKEGRTISPFQEEVGETLVAPTDLIASKVPVTLSQVPKPLRTEMLAKLRQAGAKVSVVMPTWNRRLRVREAIDSVFRQSFPVFELIVGDDGSTDGTVEDLKVTYADQVARGQLKVLALPHRGASHARNKAAEAATGDYVAYLDSDNVWLEDHVLHATYFLAIEDEISCYTAAEIINRDTNEREFLFKRHDRRQLLRANYIDLNCFVHRRELIARHGGFDERLTRLIDWDIALRYTIDQPPVSVPVVTVDYYVSTSEQSITNSQKLEPNARLIQIKLASDFIAHGVLTERQIENIRQRALAEQGDMLAKPANAQEAVARAAKALSAGPVPKAPSAKAPAAAKAAPQAKRVAVRKHVDVAAMLAKRVGPREREPIAKPPVVTPAPAVSEPAPPSPPPAPVETAKVPKAARTDRQPIAKPLRPIARPKPSLARREPVKLVQSARQRAGTDLGAATLRIVRSRSDELGDLEWLDKLDLPVEYATFDAEAGVLRGEGGAEIDPEALANSAFWHPDLSQPLPDANQVRSLLLAVLWDRVDYAVLSLSMRNSASVSCAFLRNQIVTSGRCVLSFLNGALDLSGNRVGKIVRSIPAAQETVRELELDRIFGVKVFCKTAEGYFATSQAIVDAHQSGDRGARVALPAVKRKQTVLVIPMKLAVGGVERNTVEVMRCLRDEFDFVYLTMEKVGEAQGSLHRQIGEVTRALLDMAEFSTHKQYLPILQAIHDTYRPDLVWICNGSMWFCANALEFRRIFDDAPIVDQQVYDTKEGWIRRYHEPGIRSFDHFIAINQRIQVHFQEQLKIPTEQVTLIYPAIDGAKFRRFKAEPLDRIALRDRFSLPQDGKIFSFMGRLTEQKRPIDFLELAYRRKDRSDEHYVLVGDGVLSGECEAWLAAHPDSRIRWIKNIPDVLPYWAAVDALVMTSIYEGLPIVVIEALSMGRAVLATDVGDIAKVVGDYDGGMIFPVMQQVEAMSETLDEFVGRLPEFQRNVQAASDGVVERFSTEAISRRYVESWAAATAHRSAR